MMTTDEDMDLEFVGKPVKDNSDNTCRKYLIKRKFDICQLVVNYEK